MDKENSIFLSGLNGMVGSEIHKKQGVSSSLLSMATVRIMKKIK